MKLLDSKSVLSRKKAFTNAELYEAYKSKKELEIELEKLNELKSSVETKKREEVEAFSSCIKDLQEKKGELLKEVQELEEKRKLESIPLEIKTLELDEYEKELDSTHKNIIEFKATLDADKKLFDEKSKSLNEKIHKLQVIENRILEKNNDADKRLDELKSKENDYNNKVKKLSDERNEVEKIRIDLINRELSIESKLEAIKNKEEFVSKQIKIIASRQAQLKLAYQDIKKL